MFTCMLMPLLALGGSTSFVIGNHKINFASNSSFWGMEELCLLTVLMALNGSFVQPARSASCVTSCTEQQVDSKGGLSPVPSMNAKTNQSK